MIKIKINNNNGKIRLKSFCQRPSFINDYIRSSKAKIVLKHFTNRKF